MNNANVIKLAESLLNKDFSNVNVVDYECVYVSKKNGVITVGGNNIPQKLRSLALLTLNFDKAELEIIQKPRFDSLASMIDMSRGGVMRVNKVKEYINRIALSGANQIMLYTEDIYTLEDYPCFGYLRGAYSDEELMEIDEYAADLQIEVIPCIQTLGHLEQYLAWSEADPIRDTPSVLLIDSEASYKFIEAEIAKMRKVFRSKKIHIGMDEAHDVGLGRYLREKGFVDRFDLLKRHLSAVTEICRKYDFKPMMWSDMFFRLGSPVDDYYDTEGTFEARVSENMPDVDLVYWDYYHRGPDVYRKMIKRHSELRKPIVFAGGGWSWSGFLPDYEATFGSMIDAAKVCLEENIKDTILTFWGDDGCETDYFRALYGFAIFSEYCYFGEEATTDDIDKMGALISKIATEEVHILKKTKYFYSLKQFVWGDIFYNPTTFDFSHYNIEEAYNNAANGLLKIDEYAYLVMKIASEKVYLYSHLYADYHNGKDLSLYADEYIPQLINDYKLLYKLHKKQWLDVNKVFGFEDIAARYATTIDRLEYATEVIKAYVSGESDKIEELEYTPLYSADRRNTTFKATAIRRI